MTNESAFCYWGPEECPQSTKDVLAGQEPKGWKRECGEMKTLAGEQKPTPYLTQMFLCSPVHSFIQSCILLSSVY